MLVVEDHSWTFLLLQKTYCIDLNRICLALEVCVYGPDGKEKTKPDDVDITLLYITLLVFTRGDVSQWKIDIQQQ